MPFISFHCYIALAGTSSTMLKKRGPRGHPCLVSHFSGKGFTFSSLYMMLAVGFFVDVSHQVDKVPSIPSLLNGFFLFLL